MCISYRDHFLDPCKTSATLGRSLDVLFLAPDANLPRSAATLCA
jgi:hypothetical protein